MDSDTLDLDLRAPFTWIDGQITIALPGARAVFTTARAGNLGLRGGDPAAPGNRRRLQERHGVALAWRHQVHGDRVDVVTEPNDPTATAPDADGVATRVRGLATLVLAADCVPIVLTNGEAVASVHAGWRGLEAGVIANGVAALGAGGPITAAIGPAAGPCCYEVGDEVRERFTDRHSDAVSGRHLNLKAIARRQLADAGVGEIHDTGLCTICAAPDELFSYRRDQGIRGLQAGIGWLTAGPAGSDGGSAARRPEA